VSALSDLIKIYFALNAYKPIEQKNIDNSRYLYVIFLYTQNQILCFRQGNGFKETTQISLENWWRRDEDYFAHFLNGSGC